MINVAFLTQFLVLTVRVLSLVVLIVQYSITILNLKCLYADKGADFVSDMALLWVRFTLEKKSIIL